MRRVPVPYDYHLGRTLATLADPGLLLAATDRSGRSNAMTIGWGTVGIVWGKAVFVVLVRPSRFTYGLINDAGEFTVNVPTAEMRHWVGFCGTRSGRDTGKFAALGIHTSPGVLTGTVTIDACPMVYECRSLHHNELIPANLDPAYEARFYGGEDYHRLYYGEILGAYAAPDY